MEQLAGKRILFVITKSNWGGAQVYVHALATKFAAAGADVAVAVGGTGRPGSETGVLAAKLAEAGIRVLTLPSIGRDISIRQEFIALKELIALIKQERPDVLHLNSSKAGGLGSFAGRIAKVPRIVFTVHGWPHREPLNLMSRAVRWLGSWLTIVLSHAVIAVSKCDYRTSPVLFSKRKVRVVYNGISPFDLLPRDDARAFLAPLPELAKLPRWILINSELTRNKGIDVAIHAFAGVAARFRDTALLVISDGELHESLRALIATYHLEKRIFLLGFVPNAKRYLKAGDIFAMPSRKEGFPYAILEAGMAELPVVSTYVGGIPEILVDDVNGILIQPDDVDGLADALTYLLEHPDDAKAFGSELKKTVAEQFSEQEMFDKTVEVYVQK